MWREKSREHFPASEEMEGSMNVRKFINARERERGKERISVYSSGPTSSGEWPSLTVKESLNKRKAFPG
jgi:hypothetical protein